MNAASNFTAARTTDRTTRGPVAVIRSQDNAGARPKSAPVRVRETVRRFLNALMQSLAAPHI